MQDVNVSNDIYPQNETEENIDNIQKSNSSSDITATPEIISQVNLDSYTSGVRWSNTGDLCCVSTETRVHLYNYRDSFISYNSSIKHAECLYDWQCCDVDNSNMVVTTGRYQPVHLYKVHDNDISVESTYKCINHLDELSHAFSVSIDRDRSSVICGLKGEIRVFDINRPGRESMTFLTRGDAGQRGIISCIAVSPSIPVFAAGSYDKTVGLYSSEGERLCVLRGQQGGVTQVSFSEDGGCLLTGGRKDNEIICWDLRQPGHVLWTVNRVAATNQTIGFSLRGRHLVSANTDGSVRVWDVSGHVDSSSGCLDPVCGWALHSDAVTGASWHPREDVLATSTGQRHCKLSTEDLEEEGKTISEENCLVLWNVHDIFK